MACSYEGGAGQPPRNVDPKALALSGVQAKHRKAARAKLEATVAAAVKKLTPAERKALAEFTDVGGKIKS